MTLNARHSWKLLRKNNRWKYGMTNVRKLAANRANARASTGPRTAAGKARAARNAFRHGLALSVLVDPSHKVEIDLLAREICSDCQDVQLHNLAYRIAAAQTDLIRIRKVRHDIVASSLNDNARKNPSAGDLGSITQRLAAIDRYERRALSRRKMAIREFSSLRNK